MWLYISLRCKYWGLSIYCIVSRGWGLIDRQPIAGSDETMTETRVSWRSHRIQGREWHSNHPQSLILTAGITQVPEATFHLNKLPTSLSNCLRSWRGHRFWFKRNIASIVNFRLQGAFWKQDIRCPHAGGAIRISDLTSKLHFKENCMRVRLASHKNDSSGHTYCMESNVIFTRTRTIRVKLPVSAPNKYKKKWRQIFPKTVEGKL